MEIISAFKLSHAKLLKKIEINALIMQNIAYFCSVKQLRTFLRCRLILFIMLAYSNISAINAQTTDASSMDSVEISLLTCSPHDQIYSLYGHTALRYHDLRTGEDIAFNYGVFNFKAPYFAWRFAMGHTDYQLGAFSFDAFVREYEYFGSQVTEQILNLTSKEKLQLKLLLAENYLPENRVYRYNFFYDNCSTRPRDIIERCIDGKIIYSERPDYNPSFRDILHEHTTNSPWAKFGDDICLGINADKTIGRTEQEFLPANLMHDFSRAQIYREGKYYPLVKDTRIAVKSGVQMISSGFPLSPNQCALILFLITAAITAWEIKRRKLMHYIEMIWMPLVGICGIVLTILACSEHPATTLNLQLLIFNPLPLLFIPRVYKRMRINKHDNLWTIYSYILILFLLGQFIQSYAEGMTTLACCLLLRCISHRILEDKPIQK